MQSNGQPISRQTLQTIYHRLFEAYGPQGWWPGETPFEVMVGAVLTQNTAWNNVEKAIDNLKTAGLLDPIAINSSTHDTLAGLLRPAGYFNVKTRRLKNLCAWLTDNGGMEQINAIATPELRQSLLSVNGVGPETADDILLYAFDRPVFVIDTYTRRLFTAVGLIRGNEGYEELRKAIEDNLDPDVSIYNEYHALIVRHAKERCSGENGCLHCGVEAPII